MALMNSQTALHISRMKHALRLLCEALCGALGSKDVLEKALQWELIRTDSRKWGGRTRPESLGYAVGRLGSRQSLNSLAFKGRFTVYD